MEDNKLVITPKTYRGNTVVVSSRLPAELVEKLDAVAEKTGRTRNEVVQLCLEYAIDNTVVTG